ncbi:MAG: type II toxin-antitoxin system HipA family toxin [Lachnospiraceae bacterium]|nr:type II toxin-antitoxin system HipA family toxin [Lachnospiraceae bacterium]
MTDGKILEVYYHKKTVGRLAETPDKMIAFQYDDKWLKHGFSISPLSLPLKGDVFVPNENARDRFKGLFGVFADSLPDSWGELLLDRYLEKAGIAGKDVSALDRLAYIGSSGMGALEYYPAKEADFRMESAGLDYDTIAGACEKVLSSKTTDQLDLLYRIGGSSGGTRPKILLSDKGKDWIVKFPSKDDPSISGKREYDYSLCAKKSGIAMTETKLIPSKLCEGYFQTERFDRQNGEKLFTVTFAGLLEADFRAPSCDYHTYQKLVRYLTKDNSADKEQLFRVMCFNVETHNLDDHTKNFSFVYTEDHGWRLAPAYDLTYSNTYFGEHTTSINGKGTDIKPADLMKVGEDAGISKKKCEACMEEIREGTRSLKRYMDRANGKRLRASFETKLHDLEKRE